MGHNYILRVDNRRKHPFMLDNQECVQAFASVQGLWEFWKATSTVYDILLTPTGDILAQGPIIF